MTTPGKKTLISALTALGAFILLFSVAEGFKGSDDNQKRNTGLSESEYTIKSFKLPDECHLCR